MRTLIHVGLAIVWVVAFIALFCYLCTLPWTLMGPETFWEKFAIVAGTIWAGAIVFWLEVLVCMAGLGILQVLMVPSNKRRIANARKAMLDFRRRNR